ncbi:TetR/AcrR family transcriptional regulator [Nocardia arizonensis]|uniref:TetR/AcrR family transcriptional regulator n=1 Tax=Nocardia arizonensis TaxID=1141647 RepID=UPI0006D184FB|nr:helix-turn-helix domain-containing protein [Nocardia arizonensis]
MNGPKLWRGRTLHDRSAGRREQLLAVALDLLGTEGSAAVTMRAVIRLANLSPRYFYESFDNRDALVTAVYDRVEADLLDRLHTVAATGDPRDTARAALNICADYFEEDPRRARVLLREPLTDETLRGHSAPRGPAFLRALTPLLGPDAETLFSGGQERLALVGTAVAGALIALYLDWVDGRLTVSRDRLVDTAVDVVLSLLNTRP